MFGKFDDKMSKKELKELEKQRKQQEKEQALLERFGVDSLRNPKDIQSVKNIAASMAGSSFFEVGAALGGASEKDWLDRIYHQNKILMEQNFILIRQLDEISSKLK